MIKVKLFDKALIKEYFAALSFISIIFSFISILIDIPDNCKLGASICLIIVFIIVYIVLWVKENSLKKVRLKINNSVVHIKFGDIFKENDLKVIAFNEYFDTLVDNKVISEKTLNGIYINKLMDGLEALNKSIDSDEHCNEKVIEINDNRKYGKRKSIGLELFFKIMTIC